MNAKDIEINDEFIAGLNSDLVRLLSYARVQQRIDEKLYNAEFVRGGINKTCNRCFKELNEDIMFMISEAEDLNRHRYKAFHCIDCSGEIINEFKHRYVG